MAQKANFYVDTAGRVRDHNPWTPEHAQQAKRAEAEMVAAAKRQSHVPSDCSSDILRAPARKNMRAFRDVEVMPDGETGYKVVEKAYKSGCAAIEEDIFDVMRNQAIRRRGDIPFTPLQVHAGREYRELNARVASGAVKVSSAFDLTLSGGDGLDFMDLYMRDTQRLGLFHSAIGDGTARALLRKGKRSGPSVKISDGALARIGKSIITARTLVDMVCLAEKPLSAVLRAHGWRDSGKNIKSLRASLCAALERMQGI